MKQFFLLCIVISLYGNTFSQSVINYNDQKSMLYDKTSIDKLIDKSRKLFSESSCNSKIDSVYVYNIFKYNALRKITIDDFLGSDFTKRLLLTPDYQSYKGYVNSLVIFTDSNKKLIGVADPNHFYCCSKYNKSFFEMEFFLVENIDKYKIQYFFDFVDYLDIQVVYGKDINNNIIAFFRDESNNYCILPIAEFANRLKNK